MTFVKGQSGNPSGRKAGYNIAQEKARTHVDKCIEVLYNSLGSADENSRIKAATTLLDRGFGKPQEFVEHSGDADNPLNNAITVTFVRKSTNT